MLSSKIEVLVDFGVNPDKRIYEKTLNDLKSRDGVKDVHFANGAFVVETTLPSSEILDAVSRTSGKRAVLQGFGETQSAVAMISSQCSPHRILGVVRFQQTAEGPLVADGSIDGLQPGLHGLHVHETGDLTQGCASIGGHFNPYEAPHGGPSDPPSLRHAGDLGNIAADEQGRATFRIVDDVLKVWDIIGRSVAVTERADDYGKGASIASKINGDSGQPLACGIIARSAGVFQNPKRICACDGVVVWDERDRPLAGKGRRVPEKKSCCQKETEDTARSCEKEIDEAPRCCQNNGSHGFNNYSKPSCKV